MQDLRIGGRSSSSQYQFTLQGDNLADLVEWGPVLLREMRKLPGLVDVNTDQQNRGLQASLDIDRLMAARLGITQQAIDDTLYDAFGQRQVSTMYHAAQPVPRRAGRRPGLPAKSRRAEAHLRGRRQQGRSAAQRIRQVFDQHHGPGRDPFGLLSVGDDLVQLDPRLSRWETRSTAIEKSQHDLGMPATIHGSFSGTAQAFQASLRNEPILILAALVTVYIVLGILYESYIHPITILSTLPSAGVGALLALMLCKTELNVMGLIGIILLIGIVKKNAIMMIDFALEAERGEGKSPADAIFEACLLRFRPIIMTTMAALLGGLPLALGTGDGAELRRPLGIAIVGGLIFSQVLTLYTTPVVYLYLDQLRTLGARLRRNNRPAP